MREPRGDVGDCNVASSRIDRLEREVRKRKPGQAAELVDELVIDGVRVVVVRSDRRANVDVHRRVHGAIAAELGGIPS